MLCQAYSSIYTIPVTLLFGLGQFSCREATASLTSLKGFRYYPLLPRNIAWGRREAKDNFAEPWFAQIGKCTTHTSQSLTGGVDHVGGRPKIGQTH